MSSRIDTCEDSSSSRRFVRDSRCLVKLLNCSNAFLLTPLNFFNASWTLWSFFSS
jgi:hypothetical protein